MTKQQEIREKRAAAGRIGGMQRAAKLSTRRKRQIGKLGAKARWSKPKGEAA